MKTASLCTFYIVPLCRCEILYKVEILRNHKPVEVGSSYRQLHTNSTSVRLRLAAFPRQTPAARPCRAIATFSTMCDKMCEYTRCDPLMTAGPLSTASGRRSCRRALLNSRSVDAMNHIPRALITVSTTANVGKHTVLKCITGIRITRSVWHL